MTSALTSLLLLSVSLFAAGSHIPPFFTSFNLSPWSKLVSSISAICAGWCSVRSVFLNSSGGVTRTCGEEPGSEPLFNELLIGIFFKWLIFLVKRLPSPDKIAMLSFLSITSYSVESKFGVSLCGNTTILFGTLSPSPISLSFAPLLLSADSISFCFTMQSWSH